MTIADVVGLSPTCGHPLARVACAYRASVRRGWAFSQLSISRANMRVKGKSPDLTNILPSVRARGIIVPLIVRQNGSRDSYEIVAGKRRFHAALAVAQETGEAEPVPCAITAGDDAAALEASLIENIARLDPDEVARWESFTRLVREGRTPDEIALTFGLTDAGEADAGAGQPAPSRSHALPAQQDQCGDHPPPDPGVQSAAA